MAYFIDLFLHLDVHLAAFVAQYGVMVYGMLFAIIFAETGLVIWPFLPGDSLLFAAGALAATGALDIWLVGAAAVRRRPMLGDAVNYSIGRRIGPAVFQPRRSARACCIGCSTASTSTRRTSSSRSTAAWRWCSGRFVPIVRTFVPFVAGAAAMTARRSCFYNVIGARHLGRRSASAPATCSATCRSSRRTSRWSRSASCSCRCCRW